ncbi:urm1 (Ubiquitin related modifier) domain-containing protein [Ditylenchus destructor]|uniref:Ubiquitin-related modifier 1 homolog n=1 Tax=Ditylenchus destructor TaxID=166010 RepID=A0AAD4R8D9_9BILA|nr:urm1 (Ubiquitin related modifier) domain-containing protein [Ditylenchus destructor]
MASTSLTLNFSGGAESLFDGKRVHEVTIKETDKLTVAQLLKWILVNLLSNCDKTELLICNGSVRPGILVLINDTDWEIVGGLDAELNNKDIVAFISTLHGG